MTNDREMSLEPLATCHSSRIAIEYVVVVKHKVHFQLWNELASIFIDRMAPKPQGEMSEKQQNDSPDEKLQHFDEIDLEACDFQPFLTTQSGIALNYHTSDHPEHKLLMRESYMESDQDDSGAELSSCISQAMHLLGASCLFMTTTMTTIDKEEGFPKRRVAFMGAVAFTGMIALWHIMSASRFLSLGVFVQTTESRLPIESKIPRQLQDAYRDLNDISMEDSDTLVYFQVPGGATTNTANLLSKCFGLELQNGFGTTHIDNATVQKQRQDSNHREVLITTDIWKTTSLFNTTHRARLFALFEDPVDRLLAEYTRTSSRTKDPMTMEPYLSKLVDNPMVRALSNTKEGPLSNVQLEMAKQVVRTKFLVGILDKPIPSLQRFQAFFHWKEESLKDCTKRVLSHQSTEIVKDSPEYQIASKANHLDVELYDFIRHIFQEQAAALEQ